MLVQDTLTIKLDKNTTKKLSHLKYLGFIDNMTIYSKKALAEKIDKDYAEAQAKVTTYLKNNAKQK